MVKLSIHFALLAKKEETSHSSLAGILILTSNRVGIFDEAFKSRIQLNLHYKNLDRNQRLQIWDNFLQRMERNETERAAAAAAAAKGERKKAEEVLGFGINAVEIRQKLEDLADADLNGCQVRNAISTARQYATYLRAPLAYVHLEAVINEAKKFDQYLYAVNRSFTADEIQRDKRER